MIQVATGILVAYLITYFLLPLVIRFAHDNQLYDIPDDRKKHSHGISSLGGIAIFVGLIMSLLLVSDFSNYTPELQYFIAAFFVIFSLGVLDDIFVLKAWKKFVGQLLVTAMLIFKGHLIITNLHGVFGMYELTYPESVYITFFSIILLINSFNLIDGVDGLAGSIGFITCLLFGVFFLMNNIIAYAVLAFAISGSLLAFLMFNFSPARIFMGDSGSTLIGLMAAILSIKFVESVPLESNFSNGVTPVIAFGFLLIPLMDVLRVFALRIYRKQSPLVPDRIHLHHLLQNKGLSHAEITVTLVIAQLVFSGLTLSVQTLNINLILALQFSVYFGSVFLLNHFIPVRKKMHIVREKFAAADMQDSKVYPIYPVKEKVSIQEDL